MLISCNKLKQFIKNSDSINWETIWDTFTIRTAEVEKIEKKGYDIENVVVAKIIACETHATKEKYHVLKVTDGKEEYTILCGAPNVRIDQIVALVKVGGKVGSFTIEEKKIAGILSQGMLCAMDELGIGIDHDGILELPTDYPVGADLKSLLPIEDMIVEIDNKSLTNRPDLWGHYGIAREIAAITNHELIPLELLTVEKNKNDLNICIKNHELCKRYLGITVDEINNQETPLEIKIFLHYTGMRAISLVVDLTNYIMLELGQPMHAFDKRVVKDIEVGLAKAGDKIITLDQQERILSDETLMIKNGSAYFAIAGVMGGLESEISDDTNSIFIESATFDAASVRKTATRLGLRTEASARYEKSLDPNMALIAMKRILYLLKQSNPNMQISSNLTDRYENKLEEKEIVLSKKLLNTYLGFDIHFETVQAILTKLAFSVEEEKDAYRVVVPTFRATKDVTLDCDVIEEIARMYGYENIAEKPLNMELSFEEYETIWSEEYKIKHFLATKFNFHEVHSYLWFDQSMLNKLAINKELDTIKLQENKENRILRDDLFLSLLPTAKSNVKKIDHLKIMEIASVIIKGEDTRHLSVLEVGNYEDAEQLYYNVKKTIVSLFQTYKKMNVEFANYEGFDYYDSQYSKDIYVNQEKIGSLVVLKQKLTNYVSKKKFVVGFELALSKYMELKAAQHKLLEENKYPTVELDYTVIDYHKNKYVVIENILNDFDNSYIKSLQLVDSYESDDMIKYTIRYVIASNDHTFTSQELNEFKQKFIAYIKEKGLDILD